MTLKFDPIKNRFVDEELGIEPGSKIFYGEGEPNESIGSPGDFYIETESWEIYQKTAVGWGEGIALIGKPGEPGKDGERGEVGPPGRDGIDGRDGKDGIDGIDGLGGVNGRNGVDGKSVELRNNKGVIEWRRDGEEWHSLYTIPIQNIGAGGGTRRLGELRDTRTTNPSTDQILRYDGTHWVNSDEQSLSGYVPYIGATQNLNLATYRVITHGIQADATDGLYIYAANGTTQVGNLGPANTANVTWYGSHNFNAATQDTIAAFVGSGKTLSSLSTSTYPSLTELSYVKGVTSSIQTQISGLVPYTGATANVDLGVYRLSAKTLAINSPADPTLASITVGASGKSIGTYISGTRTDADALDIMASMVLYDNFQPAGSINGMFSVSNSPIFNLPAGASTYNSYATSYGPSFIPQAGASFSEVGSVWILNDVSSMAAGTIDVLYGINIGSGNSPAGGTINTAIGLRAVTPTAGTTKIAAWVDDLSVGTSRQFTISTNGIVTAGTWSGSTIAINKGGTNNTSFTNNTLAYYDGTRIASVAVPSAQGMLVRAGSGGAPEWTAITYPNSAPVVGQIIRASVTSTLVMSTFAIADTFAKNDLLYASGANVVGALTSSVSSVLVTDGAGTPSWQATLPAASFPALTGDVTTSAGSVATTIAANAVTYAKMQSVSATSRLLGSSSTTTPVQEITIGSGLSLSGTTLTSTGLGGTVTSFSSGGLSPLFTTSVATATTTPALSFSLSSAASGTWFGNNTGVSTAPSYNNAGALTKVDDTNVTLTLGGTPTTALLNATSLTLGWTGQLGLTRGGTNASLIASNGGIVWSNASQLQILAGTATANKMLLSGATATPSWSASTIPSSAGATANKVLLSDGTNYVLSTPTFPNASATAGKLIRSDGTNWAASTSTFANTYAVSTILYASSANTIAGLATANNSILVTNGTGVPSLDTSIPTAVTIGGSYIYRAGGTDIAIADGGTNASSQTTNGITYYNGSAITSGSSLTTDGSGRLGIGGATDSTITLYVSKTVTATSGSLYQMQIGGALGASSGTLTDATYLYLYPNFSVNAGIIPTAYGLLVGSGVTGGTITTGIGIFVSALGYGTNRYAMYLAAPTGGTTNYGAFIGGPSGFNASPSTDTAVAIGGLGSASLHALYVGGTVSKTATNLFGARFTNIIVPQSDSYNGYGVFVDPTFTSGASGINAAVSHLIYMTIGGSGTVSDARLLAIDTGAASGVTVTTAYSLKIEPLGLGTTRFGLHVSVPTGGTNNICAYFDGIIGQGQYESSSYFYQSKTVTAASGNLFGFRIQNNFGATTSNTVSNASQIYISPSYSNNLGTIAEASAIYVASGTTAATITNGYGIFIRDLGYGTNRYAMYLTAPTGGTNNYCLRTTGGIGVGVDHTTGVTEVRVAGNVVLNSAGNGFLIKEGSNATMGVATLVAGTVTVSTTKVTASSRIFLTSNSNSGTEYGIVKVSARTASTSFVITSYRGNNTTTTAAGDTSTVAWVIIEPS